MRGRRFARGIAVAVVAMTVAAIVALVTAPLLQAKSPPARAQHTPSPGLTIRYQHRDFTFTSFTKVSCRTTESGHEVMRAWVASRGDFQGKKLIRPVLSFDARLDLLAKGGTTYTLPESAGNTENNRFTLFAATPYPGAQDNEASSQEEGAAGTVTVTNLRCGSDPTVTVAADATLGSELSGPTIPIKGRLAYP